MREIGGFTVDEFLNRVSARELGEWQAVLEREAHVADLVRNRVEPSVAHAMVWKQDE